MTQAQNTTYPPGASHLGTTGLMCLTKAGPVVPRLGPADKSAPRCLQVRLVQAGGASRADGIEVPKVQDDVIFTGKPEAPKRKKDNNKGMGWISPSGCFNGIGSMLKPEKSWACNSSARSFWSTLPTGPAASSAWRPVAARSTGHAN